MQPNHHIQKSHTPRTCVVYLRDLRDVVRCNPPPLSSGTAPLDLLVGLPLLPVVVVAVVAVEAGESALAADARGEVRPDRSCVTKKDDSEASVPSERAVGSGACRPLDRALHPIETTPP